MMKVFQMETDGEQYYLLVDAHIIVQDVITKKHKILIMDKNLMNKKY